GGCLILSAPRIHPAPAIGLTHVPVLCVDIGCRPVETVVAVRGPLPAINLAPTRISTGNDNVANDLGRRNSLQGSCHHCAAYSMIGKNDAVHGRIISNQTSTGVQIFAGLSLPVTETHPLTVAPPGKLDPVVCYAVVIPPLLEALRQRSRVRMPFP